MSSCWIIASSPTCSKFTVFTFPIKTVTDRYVNILAFRCWMLCTHLNFPIWLKDPTANWKTCGPTKPGNKIINHRGNCATGWPTRTYIQQLCTDIGGSLEDLPEVMNDRDEWWERVREICASSTTW